MTSSSEDSPFKINPSDLPRDARLLSLILSSLQVQDYDPIILPQLLELSHRYIYDVLTDAQVFCDHAGRKDLSVDDIKLAISSRVSHSFTGPPSLSFLQGIAEKKNSIPLPLVPEKFGLRLPPEKHTLTRRNFHIVPKASSVTALAEKRKREEEHTSAMDVNMAVENTSLLVPSELSQNLPVSAPVPATNIMAGTTLMTSASKQDDDDDYDMEDA